MCRQNCPKCPPTSSICQTGLVQPRGSQPCKSRHGSEDERATVQSQQGSASVASRRHHQAYETGEGEFGNSGSCFVPFGGNPMPGVEWDVGEGKENTWYINRAGPRDCHGERSVGASLTASTATTEQAHETSSICFRTKRLDLQLRSAQLQTRNHGPCQVLPRWRVPPVAWERSCGHTTPVSRAERGTEKPK